MTRLPLSAEADADDLQTTPLAHLLLDLLGARRTGTLLVRAADGAMLAAIRVDDGRPMAVLAEETGARRVTEVLIPLCGLAEGRLEFVDGRDLVGGDGLRAAGPIDPVPMIVAAMRKTLREDAAERSMKIAARSLIELRVGLDLGRYAFDAEELLVVRGLAQGAAELDELNSRTQVPPELMRRVLYVLHITRGVVMSPLHRTISGVVSQAPPLTGASLPPSASRRPPFAGSSSGRPASGTYSQRPGAAARSSRPASASSQLPRRPESLPAQRQSLPAGRTSQTPRPFGALESGPLAMPRSSTRPDDARAQRDHVEALWQRAKLLSQRGDHAEALRVAHQAVKLGEPSPADEGLLGWLMYQHGGARQTADRHVWKCLNHALERDPLCEEALYYRGLVLSLTGHAERAQGHFERVLMLDPKHVGAQREIRIYQMRREHERQQSGFLHRLLGARSKAKGE